jgi:serine/threonine-protein kinase
MGEGAGVFFFAMDYIPGENASQCFQREGPLAIPRAVNLACGVLEALEHAHTRKFVHRDIKPSNILLTRQGSRESPKLADFGLARAYQASELSGLTVLGDSGGTPQFIAPEQITRFRDASPSADQYGVAATLYLLLTGQPLFEADNVQQLFARTLYDDPVPVQLHRPEVPDGLAVALLRALAKSPQDRFANVAAFREALLPFAASSR